MAQPTEQPADQQSEHQTNDQPQQYAGKIASQGVQYENYGHAHENGVDEQGTEYTSHRMALQDAQHEQTDEHRYNGDCDDHPGQITCRDVGTALLVLRSTEQE